MKNHLFLLLILFLSDLTLAQFPHENFEIVESIPLETNLENDEIRNTEIVWLEMINNAKKTIDIEQFYIANEKDKPLENIIEAIEIRAKKGVKVRIIAENKMAKTYPETINRLNKIDNIEVRILSAFEKIHGINHSKYFVIDNERVFIGSQNFDCRALNHIHEIGLNIKNENFANSITEIFNMNWQQAESGKLIKTKKHGEKTSFQVKIFDETIEFYPTASPYYNMPNEFYADELAIVEAISNAKKSVKIQLLSYSPSAYEEYYSTLDNAIRDAAIRKVKVEILLSDWCTKEYEIPYLKSLQVLPNVDVKLSTIPEYSGGYISFARVEHCKLMVVDEKLTWIGTSNWKKNYFYNSRNLGLIIRSKSINKKIMEIFDKSWNSEYTNLIDINKNYKPKQHGDK